MTRSLPFDAPVLHALEAGLTARGFRRYPQEALGAHDRKVLWQRPLESVEPVCRYNAALQLNLMLFETKLSAPHLAHLAVEAEVYAQLPDEQWVRVTLTALDPTQVLEQLDRLQAKLVAAWLALAALSAPAVPGPGPYVLRYADGAYNYGPGDKNGFPVSLAEATHYPTREEAQAKAQDLGPDVEVLDVNDIQAGQEPRTLQGN